MRKYVWFIFRMIYNHTIFLAVIFVESIGLSRDVINKMRKYNILEFSSIHVLFFHYLIFSTRNLSKVTRQKISFSICRPSLGVSGWKKLSVRNINKVMLMNTSTWVLRRRVSIETNPEKSKHFCKNILCKYRCRRLHNYVREWEAYSLATTALWGHGSKVSCDLECCKEVLALWRKKNEHCFCQGILIFMRM